MHGYDRQQKETLRKEAEERNAAWAKLSAKQQLAELDKRRGKSTRQRARITKKHAEKPNN